MADTTAAPNNKPVSFSGKTEREMSSWNNKGIANSNGSGKGNPAGLEGAGPMKMGKSKAVRKIAKRAMKRGMISEKAAKRHLGGA